MKKKTKVVSSKIVAVSPVTEVLTKATGKSIAPYRRVKVSDCVPNDWNPNKMTEATREKLTTGIKKLLTMVGSVPPIVARPHPKKPGCLEIIDGFHRWDIFRTEEIEEIDAYVIDVDTRMAMILTDTLNYLRGDPDPDRFVQYLHRLLTENEMTPEDASAFIPETASEITEALDAYGLRIDQVSFTGEDVSPTDADGDDQLMELKFAVYKPQAEIIEAELARISNLLQGKNLRGRALEFMAVTSSQTPTENLTGEVPPSDAPKKLKFSALKKKLKEKAA